MKLQPKPTVAFSGTWLWEDNPQLAAFLHSIENAAIILGSAAYNYSVLYVNPALTAVTGFKESDFLGSQLSTFVLPPTDRDLTDILETVEDGSFAHAVLKCKSRFNGGLWYDMNLCPAISADNSVPFIIGILTNISNRKNIEWELDRRVRQQTAIATLGRQALTGMPIEELVDEALALVRATLNMEMNTVFRLLPGTSILHLKWADSWPKGVIGMTELRALKGTLAHHILETRQPLAIDDFQTDKKYCPVTIIKEAGVRALLSAPILCRTGPFGIIFSQSRSPRIFNKNDVHFLKSIADILAEAIERLHAEEYLRNRHQRFDLIIRGSDSGLWDWDLKKGTIYFSTRWKSMLGYHKDKVGNNPREWLDRIHREDRNRFRKTLDAHLRGETPYFSIKHRIRHHDSYYYWLQARGSAVHDDNGIATRIAGSLTKIIECQEAVDGQLSKDVFHDTLTELSSRTLFKHRLLQALTRWQNDKKHKFALLLVDLDRFKIINDSLGHSYGNLLLIEVAQRLKRCTRNTDTVARLRDDKFAILLEELEHEGRTYQVARRINESLAVSFNLASKEVVSNASIGIAISAPYHDKPEDVIRDADIAMYQAKLQGRARYVTFEKGMHVHAVTQLEMESDLRRAITHQEYHLDFQPVISLKTGLISSFEALLRWKHPEQGTISPSDFIPIAEETGLIVPIGIEVLHAAARQIRDWSAMFPDRKLTMNINVSPKQFAEGNLTRTVADILKDTGIKGNKLNLEITEGVMMENLAEMAEYLCDLKRLGVKLYIDDFGTGYSSLGHLQHFPIDALKVDQSFVMTMSKSNETSEIVRTIIALARNLNLKTVAEGVETKEHLNHLRNLHCSFGQGYLFSHPLTAEKATKLLVENRKW